MELSYKSHQGFDHQSFKQHKILEKLKQRKEIRVKIEKKLTAQIQIYL